MASGEIKHASEEARWIARRNLNLYYADGRHCYQAERSIEPFIEAAGIDPLTLGAVDYDRLTGQIERWTAKRKRKIRKSGRPTVTLQDPIVLAKPGQQLYDANRFGPCASSLVTNSLR